MYILNDLWYGNVPFSERGLHRGSPGHKALHEATEAESNLLKLLNEEQKELLKVYDDAYSKMLGICECESFSIGFRVGVRLMLDALNDKDSELVPLRY